MKWIKVIFAIAVCVGGLVVLYRGVVSGRAPVVERVPMEATGEVLEALDEGRFDVALERETAEGVFERVGERVVEFAERRSGIRRIGGGAAEDLGEAFVERLRFMYVPEAGRDYEAISKRGDPRSYEVWLGRFEKYIESRGEVKRLPSLGIDGVAVKVLGEVEEGEEADGVHQVAEGFGVAIGRGVPLEVIPNDPLSEGMVVVEVVMPMERKDVRSGELAPAIQGYRFAWHRGMKRWIPFESVQYTSPGGAFTNPPL